MAHSADLVDELADELDTWLGVRIVNAGPDDARVFSDFRADPLARQWSGRSRVQVLPGALRFSGIR